MLFRTEAAESQRVMCRPVSSAFSELLFHRDGKTQEAEPGLEDLVCPCVECTEMPCLPWPVWTECHLCAGQIWHPVFLIEGIWQSHTTSLDFLGFNEGGGSKDPIITREKHHMGNGRYRTGANSEFSESWHPGKGDNEVEHLDMLLGTESAPPWYVTWLASVPIILKERRCQEGASAYGQ